MGEMRLWIAKSCLLAGCLVAAPVVCSGQQQPPNSPNQPNQGHPAGNSQKPPSNANPFPEDTNNVPVLPNAKSGNEPETAEPAAGRVPLPGQDNDPARSPDEPPAGAAGESGNESSSDVPGLDSLLPRPDEDTKSKTPTPDFHETASDDITVGEYYLGRKDWKAALSRFQSALVLAPENAEVYWGLAESDRHLGDFAGARVNYLKVMEYDPGSRHFKEAEKALKEPGIANAKPSAPGKAAEGSPQ